MLLCARMLSRCGQPSVQLLDLGLQLSFRALCRPRRAGLVSSFAVPNQVVNRSWNISQSRPTQEDSVGTRTRLYAMILIVRGRINGEVAKYDAP
jgi:hypothetical protein